MSSSLLAPVLLVPLLSGGGPGPQTDDAARLVPADATVLVRLESARAWNELVHAFAPLAGEEAAGFDLQATLDGMADPDVAPATLPRLDPERPLYLAVSLDAEAGPGVTLVAPVTNEQIFQLHATFGTTTSARLGSYVAVTNRAEVTVGEGPHPLVADLRPGLVSAHVDLGRIIATFRPLIEMGLAQAEGALDQIPEEEMPFDVGPIMEVYLETARDLIDSARTLDFALTRRGEQLSIRMDYGESEARLPEMSLADVSSMLGLLDPESPVQMVSNGKWTEYMALFDDFLDAALEIYPEPLRGDMRRMFAQQAALDAQLAPGIVASFDLGPAGLRGGYFARAREPKALLEALEELVRTLDHEGGLLRAGPAERLAVDGLEARVLPLELQFDAWTALLAEATPEGQEEPASPEELREIFQAIYGERLRIAFASQGDVVAVCVGSNDSELRAALARLAKPALPAPKVQALLAELEPGAVGFAYHFDFGRFAGRMADLMQVMVPEAIVFPDLDFSMDTWASVNGATWSGGMTMNLAELIAFGKGLEELDGR